MIRGERFAGSEPPLCFETDVQESARHNVRTVMCNPYARTPSQDEIRTLAEVLNDHTGNLLLMPDIYPDSAVPIVRNGQNSRELVPARWGMPSPTFALKGGKVDRGGGANIRKTASPHWQRRLGVFHRHAETLGQIELGELRCGSVIALHHKRFCRQPFGSFSRNYGY